MRPSSTRGVPKACPGACQERPDAVSGVTNQRSGTVCVEITFGPPAAPSSMTRTTTWSAPAPAGGSRVPTNTPAPTSTAAAMASGTVHPIGMATPTSMSAGTCKSRCSMSVPPHPQVFALVGVCTYDVVGVGDVLVGLFFVGVERRELGRTGVAVQAHPHAPPRGHQQAFALAGLVAVLLLLRTQVCAVLDDLAQFAVLHLAVPLVGRGALNRPTDLRIEPIAHPLRQHVQFDAEVP